MKKFLLIFAIIFLASCGQNNASQNISLKNEENIQTEKTENNSENISKNINSENEAQEEVDYIEKYRQHKQELVAEIAKLPEEERTKKVGNFKFVFEEDGISVDSSNKEKEHLPWLFIKYGSFYTDPIYEPCHQNFYTSNNHIDNQETFEKIIKSEECSVTQENILKHIEIINLENDFAVLIAGLDEFSTMHLFDKKNEYFVNDVYFPITNILRKWNKIFVYSANRHWHYHFSVFIDDSTYAFKIMEIKEYTIDMEKSTFTEKWMELKDVNGEIIGTFNF